MRRQLYLWLFLYEPLIELAYLLLRWMDNKRKGKTISDFWSYLWVIFVYGEVNGRVPLGDIKEGWRKGTWFEQTRGREGWQGPTYLDTEYGTIYKGREIELTEAQWAKWSD